MRTKKVNLESFFSTAALKLWNLLKRYRNKLDY